MSREKLYQNEQLKKIRTEHLHISQQKLANLLGIPVNRIKDIESGKARMPIEMALSLEEKFNLDFRWLLTGKGQIRHVNEVPGEMPVESVDTRVLHHVLEEVEEGLARRSVTVDPAKKARLILVLYEYSIETGKPIGPDTVDRYLGLMT